MDRAGAYLGSDRAGFSFRDGSMRGIDMTDLFQYGNVWLMWLNVAAVILLIAGIVFLFRREW